MDELDVVLQKARELNKSQKGNEVIELLNNSLLRSFNDSDLFAEKAIAYYKLNRTSSSIRLFERAIELSPNKSVLYFRLGRCYIKSNNLDKAILLFKRAIRLNPKSSIYFAELGYAYFLVNNYNKSIDSLKRAIILKSDRPNYYYALSNVYIEIKEYNKALLVINKAIALNPFDYDFYYALGLIFYKQKKYEDAIEAYKKSIELNPTDPLSFYSLGNIYFSLKDFTNSKYYFEKQLELEEDNTSFTALKAKSKITELEKLISDDVYRIIRELVNKIKGILLFKEKCITHYTSLTVAKALILNNNKFRLSEGAFLNDTSEGREIFRFLSLNISDRINETVAEPFTQKPFIGSFVSDIKHDDLTLWRMYGKENKEEAKGCAITLDRQGFLDELRSETVPNLTSNTNSNFEFEFYRVAYRNENIANQFIVPGASKSAEADLNIIMKSLLEEIQKNVKGKKTSTISNVVKLINEIAFLFKTAEYQYEHELRLVVDAIGLKKHLNQDCVPPRVFIELIEIGRYINKITLGPKVERADEWSAALFYSLDSKGFSPNIFLSHLPFK